MHDVSEEHEFCLNGFPPYDCISVTANENALQVLYFGIFIHNLKRLDISLCRILPGLYIL